MKALAFELSKGKVEIPSFPEVTSRIQRILRDANVPTDKVVRVIGSEPVLTARVLQISNSVAFNPNGRKIVELRTAVMRLGFDMLRSATMAFAVEQLRRAKGMAHLQKPLHSLWQRSVQVAALAYVISKRYSAINCDTALLSGMLHSVGKLYILSRANEFPGLIEDNDAYQTIVADWHANVAKAVLENWDIADDVVAAVHDYEDLDRDPRGPVTLTDILSVATVCARFHPDAESAAQHIGRSRVGAKLQLKAEDMQCLLAESTEEVQTLREALSG
ncbi:MAG: HDOD domain-containing protein [Steroidobacteraceae bacterium]